MKGWIQDNWLKVVAIFFALGALAPIPYFAYYQLMNWIVVGAALMTTLHAYQQKSPWIAWLFALVAVIFNPLAPLYFPTNVWHIADVVVAILFVASFYYIGTPKRK